MKTRGFTLIEVLVSLAIFALAAVGLGSAYSNVLLGRMALRQNSTELEDMARARAALMESANFEDAEGGGDIHLPGNRTARWKSKIEPTSVSDLFSVVLTVEIQAEENGEYSPEKTEARLLLRPTWSVPADRTKIRDEAKQKLERERGYTELKGNSSFVSSPTSPRGVGATGGGGKGNTPPGKGTNNGKGSNNGKGTNNASGKGNNNGGGKNGGATPPPAPKGAGAAPKSVQ